MQRRWTLQAADDLAAIRDFIAQGSPVYARQIAERLYEAAVRLEQFPDSGRMVPERQDPKIREVLRSPYRIVYRRGADDIELLTIHHASRPLPEDLGKGAV